MIREGFSLSFETLPIPHAAAEHGIVTRNGLGLDTQQKQTPINTPVPCQAYPNECNIGSQVPTPLLSFQANDSNRSRSTLLPLKIIPKEHHQHHHQDNPHPSPSQIQTNPLSTTPSSPPPTQTEALPINPPPPLKQPPTSPPPPPPQPYTPSTPPWANPPPHPRPKTS